jgi:hypothetical protein
VVAEELVNVLQTEEGGGDYVMILIVGIGVERS